MIFQNSQPSTGKVRKYLHNKECLSALVMYMINAMTCGSVRDTKKKHNHHILLLSLGSFANLSVDCIVNTRLVFTILGHVALIKEEFTEELKIKLESHPSPIVMTATKALIDLINSADTPREKKYEETEDSLSDYGRLHKTILGKSNNELLELSYSNTSSGSSSISSVDPSDGKHKVEDEEETDVEEVQDEAQNALRKLNLEESVRQVISLFPLSCVIIFFFFCPHTRV